MTSHRIRSGFSFRASSTPARPFSAPLALNFSIFKIVRRLRRISGSSSITRIFAIQNVNLVGLTEYWHAHGDRRSSADPALHLDSAGMELNASFDNYQAHTCPRALPDIESPMEGVQLTLLHGYRSIN